MAAKGTPREVKVDGLRAFPDRDCNARLPSGQYENEATPHAGGNQKKMLRASGALTNVTCQVTKTEFEKWQALNDDSRDNMSLSFIDRAGNVYRAVGWVEVEGLDDADNMMTLRLIPNKGIWTLFLP